MVLLARFLLLILLFSSVASEVDATEKKTIFVSILPQKYFVQQISGNYFDVEVMVKPGASPATYEPKASQMRKITSAKAYLGIGVAFEESWLPRISAMNKDMRIVHTDDGIDKMAMSHHHEEENHDGHTDDADGRDPHIWLAPSLVKKQLDTILVTLKELAPEQAAVFDLNHHHFVKKIDLLDSRLRQVFQQKKQMQFMVFHPSWGYFAHEYGLEQVAVEIEGKKPKPSQLVALIAFAKDNDIRVIFAQPQFSVKSAKLIAREIDGELLTLDPLSENWLENMENVADKFNMVLR